ncbi:RNA-binding protein [Colletotrichum musicola]|uniref:RNA-binding protein n=1 Tax=Colletotrichum musicola TaxID=2175873 RepID=A0A8H6KWB2_9PEZI|nr:RNA-binding protein [Colletotrichum musicola]
MLEQEATPEFQATADLSPLSPSPLHSAAPAVVPVLQDTADILDAMSSQANGVALGGVDAHAPVPAPAEQHAPPFSEQAQEGSIYADGDGDGDDADSLDDAYGAEEEEYAGADKVQEQQVEPDAGEDEYLKSFDTPSADEEDSAELDHVSKAPESINSAASLTAPSQMQTGRPPVTVAVADASSARPAAAASAGAGDHSSADPAAPSTAAAHPVAAPEDDTATEISRLVAEMTGNAAPGAADYDRPPAGPAQNHDTPTSILSAASATLPAKPPMPSQAQSAYPSSEYPGFQLNSHPSHNAAPPAPGQPGSYAPVGAQGAPGTLPTVSLNASPYNEHAGHQAAQANDASDRQVWDKFIIDESRYTREAKWDRFPDGSRVFIGSRSLSSGRPDGAVDFFSGNLSSERVSKRDVFNIFSKYGRLAQISLKSAYGFVQYHSVEEAQAAVANLQETEIKGRKIHLEFSRAQKKKDGNERNRSPDRGRGGRQQQQGQGRQDRHDGGHHNDRRGRDDYRPGRNSPPKRNGYGNGRDDGHGRDRHYEAHDRSRGRSRSPAYGHARHDSYRRRSPSPPKGYRGGPMSEERLDIPRRYGNDVPDVQFLLLQQVSNEFVAWVQRAFTDQNLKVAVMFLNPNFPRETIEQRQVVEGVHGIVYLDMQAQQHGKIPLRLFDRSSGVSARFDDYLDLDPPIAAALIQRATAQAAQAAQYQAPAPPAAHHQPYPGYGQTYAAPQPHHQAPQGHAPTYPQGPRGGPPPQAPQGHMPTYPQGPHGGAPTQAPPAAVSTVPADLASMMNGMDNATLQHLLASLGGPGAVAANSAAGAANGQIQALASQMATATPAAAPPPAAYGPRSGGENPNRHVENIMATLARLRQ